ncbi:hypothetical protein [Luteimicrobium subarcticum]|uniref:Uncharacterized protein n=1 Tax=Luteimicrobium subarcticum TaxID=620910 RepID=A0A2M8WT76_9MICO|nr:hypothetical protein [Luteimicrobium subarcticum]PJI94133.1 hypothetical protein CLV34_1619 [Luteimicrobium subarcticum]
MSESLVLDVVRSDGLSVHPTTAEGPRDFVVADDELDRRCGAWLASGGRDA